MKERYEVPEMEIVEFETEDIITTSGEPETPFCAVFRKSMKGIRKWSDLVDM